MRIIFKNRRKRRRKDFQTRDFKATWAEHLNRYFISLGLQTEVCIMKLKSFIVPILLVMLLISGCAGASTTVQPSDSSSDVNAKEIFQNIITLKYLADFGILKGPIDPMEGFTRFILLILLFALLFRVLDSLLGRGTAVAVALVVSLMTVIFIPGTVLLAAASSYGTLFSLLLMLVPVGIAVGAYWFLKDHPWIRVVVLAVLLWLLYQMEAYITSWASGFTTPVNTLFGIDISGAGLQQVSGYGLVILGVASWIGAVIYVVWALLIWDIISALFSSATGHSGKFSSSIKNVVGTMAKEGWNKFKNKEARAAKMALREHIEDEKELEKLKKAMETAQLFEERYAGIMKYNGFEEANDKTDITKALDGLKEEVKDAEEQIKPLLRKTRKAENAFGKLLKELREKKYDTSKIEAKEKAILLEHDKCVKALNKAKDEFNSSDFKNADSWYELVKLENPSSNGIPYTFVAADGRGGGPGMKTKNARETKKGSGKWVDNFKSALEKYKTSVDNIKTYLTEAITAENNAKTMLEGVIAEAEKMMA